MKNRKDSPVIFAQSSSNSKNKNYSHSQSKPDSAIDVQNQQIKATADQPLDATAEQQTEAKLS
jgi:hypothetical protein